MTEQDEIKIKNYLKTLSIAAHSALKQIEELKNSDKAKIRQIESYQNAFEKSIDDDLFTK